jgi:ferrous-iron efflux pump FieF
MVPSPRPSGPPSARRHRSRAVTRRITRLSVAVAVALIALKAFALGASGSVSILASLTDSSLDLVASLATFLRRALGRRPAGRGAPLRPRQGRGDGRPGPGRADLRLGRLHRLGGLAADVRPPPGRRRIGWAVGVILISIALTAGLVWLQTRALKQTGSLAVAGDRSHYAADLAANVVVLIGVVSGAWLHAPGLDAAAGLVVAVWLFWGALGLLKDASDHLLDRSAGEVEQVAVTTAVLADPRSPASTPCAPEWPARP